MWTHINPQEDGPLFGDLFLRKCLMTVRIAECRDVTVIDASCGCVSINSAIAAWTDDFTPWELVSADYVGAEELPGLTHEFLVSSPDIQPPRRVFVVMDWGDLNGW